MRPCIALVWLIEMTWRFTQEVCESIETPTAFSSLWMLRLYTEPVKFINIAFPSANRKVEVADFCQELRATGFKGPVFKLTEHRWNLSDSDLAVKNWRCFQNQRADGKVPSAYDPHDTQDVCWFADYRNCRRLHSPFQRSLGWSQLWS